MNEDIEKLIKIQGVLNKEIYHLFIQTDCKFNYRWILYHFVPDEEIYFSIHNRPIMNSEVDSINDLFNYLKKHNGFDEEKLKEERMAW